ncbi:MAG: hypothetical protein MI725_01155 [Pirellulales bacterium]|nr:hypothetical protein [Pirellulales bacterium]
MRRATRSLSGVLLLYFLSTTSSYAGGGPENVFLLVNSASPDSVKVADYYVKLRKIPASNVFNIEYTKSKAYTSAEIFREQILLPTLKEIQRRGLSSQIDYLVYSCDFPWRVDFTKEFPDQEFPPQIRPIASLTGATYLTAFVLQKRKEIVGLNTNFYFTPATAGITISKGFRSQYQWAPGGRRAAGNGLRYFLSAMLGVTFGRGNTVEEITRYLKLSAEVDGKKPKGTIYYVKNNGPRSKPRHDGFERAIREIRLAGVHAELIDGKYITRKPNVQGLTIGAAQLQVQNSGCKFLPGAYCDNFTSFGGHFPVPKKPPGQTCVTEFLREGAAGANGTVVEPYNIPQKFPSAELHVHYVHGCSLAEAFYQSVLCPYQQILVGDPLCQPWANIPQVSVTGISRGDTIRGKVEITPAALTKSARAIKSFELYVDGKRTQQCKPGERFVFDARPFEDGPHEIRVVAVEGSPIETQGRWIGLVSVKKGQ